MPSLAQLMVELGLDAKGFESGIAKAGGSASKLGSTLKKALAVTAIAGAGAAVGKALYGIGDAYDSMSDAIAVKTGATGAQLKTLQTEAIDVFKTVPTSMQTAGDAIAAVSTKTGATGKALKSLTASEIELARITGTDLNANIDASAKIFNAWGVSVKDQTKTLDQIFAASQKSGVGVDRLMQEVQQFNPVLRAMGLGAGASANLIGKLDKAGLHTSVVMQGFKKSIGVFAKQGVSDVKAGLTDVFNGIKGAGSAADATAIAMKYFGAKAGPELAQAIRDGTLSVDDLTGSVDANGKSILATAKSTYDFSENWQLFKNNVAAALIPVGSFVFALGNKLIPVLTGGIKAIADFADGLAPFVNAMKAAAATGFPIKDLVEFLPPGLANLEHGFLLVADAIGDVVRNVQNNGLSGFFESIGPALSQALSGIGEIASAAFKDLGGVIADAVGMIDWGKVGNAFLTGLGVAWDFVLAHPGFLAGAALGGPIGAAIGAAIDAIGWERFGGLLLAGLQTAFASVPWRALGATVLAGVQSAVAGVPWRGIWDGIGDIAAGLYDKFQRADYSRAGFVVGKGIHDAVAAAAPVVASVGADLIQALFNGLQNNWQTILKWVALWPVMIPAAVVGASVALAPKAAEFMSGFLEGLGVNWDGQVQPWLVDIQNKAIAAVGDLSATLHDTGYNLVIGLFNGVIDAWNTGVTFLASVPDMATGAVGDVSQTLYATGVSLIQGMWDGALAQWIEFSGFLGERGGVAANAVGDLSRDLYSAGVTLLEGLWNGAGDQWDSVTNWLGGLGGTAAGWVGDLSGYLYGAGRDLIGGLISGIQSMLAGLQSVVGAVLSVIGLINRQGNSPWPAMIESGQDAIDGLIIGVGNRRAQLARTIDATIGAFAVSPAMSAAWAGAGSAGNGAALTLDDKAKRILEAVNARASNSAAGLVAGAVGGSGNGAGGGPSFTIQAGAFPITVNALPGMDEQQLADYTGAAIARELGLRSAS